MVLGLDFHVIWDNLTYFFIGRYPHGPLGGVGLTFYLAVVSCILSFFGGLILGLLAISRNRLIRYPSEAVIQFVRGMPLIMVIFWMYFLYPNLMGQPMPESQTVILALTFFTSAYMSQIVKAGIEAVWACLTYNVQLWIRLRWRRQWATSPARRGHPRIERQRSALQGGGTRGRHSRPPGKSHALRYAAIR